jgi:hypothetical protein
LTELSRMATLSTNSRTPLSSTICCPIRIFGPSLGSRIRKRENEYDSRTKKGQTRRSSIRDHHNFQSIQWLRFQSSQHGISRPWPRAIHSAPDLLGLDFREQRFGERFHVRAIRSRSMRGRPRQQLHRPVPVCEHHHHYRGYGSERRTAPAPGSHYGYAQRHHTRRLITAGLATFSEWSRAQLRACSVLIPRLVSELDRVLA